MEYLLLREGGVFVLFGSKPIVHSGLCVISEKKLLQTSNKMPKISTDKIHKIKLNFEIKGWENVKDRIKLSKYLLILKKHESVGLADVYFVNIANTTKVLEEYHDIFKKRLGFDFDPLTIVHELKNTNSRFWENVKKDLVLQGLVFGYGKKNSFLFETWVKNENDSLKIKNFEKIGFKTTNDHLIDATVKVDYQNFPLPVFRSLLNDPTLVKYKKEREQIIEIYNKNDPLKITLEKLCE